MRGKFACGLAVFATFVLGACSASKPIARPDDLHSGTLVRAGDRVFIALAPGIAERVEQLDCDFRFGAVRTGEIWQEVFVGSVGDPVLTIERVTLPCSFVMNARFTYNVQATVHWKGIEYRVEASATRSAYSSTSKALREAIEKAVIDTAAKADAALRPNQRPRYE